MTDARYGGQVLADECTEYSGSCSVKNTYTVHANKDGIVYEISDSLQSLVTTHPPYINILLEIKLLLVHLVMCLTADKRTFGYSFRLGGGVASLQTIQFHRGFNASESDGCIFTIDFHDLSDACLSLDLYVLANSDRYYFRGSGCL